jgi:hypothetical protein
MGSMMAFRGSAAQRHRLPPKSAKRQGEITVIAFQLLGGKLGAMAFLNNRHADLDARPIDRAIESEEGFAQVEAVIRAMASADQT